MCVCPSVVELHALPNPLTNHVSRRDRCYLIADDGRHQTKPTPRARPPACPPARPPSSLSVMYSWTSLFLQAGDAAMFNLSLLTSDVYALIFSYLVEKVTPNGLYFVAFAIIFVGLVVYHLQPPPTEASPADHLSGLGFLDATGEGGSGGDKAAWGKDSSRGMSLCELGRELSGESTDSNTTYGGDCSPASLSPSPTENKPWLL